MKILVLISIAMTAISSTLCSNSSEAQDITTLINITIARTFHSMNSVTINKLVLSMENLKTFAFETYTDCEVGPFENGFYFTGITVTPIEIESANLRQEFNRNRMTLFFSHLSLEIKGYLGATPGTVHAGFERSLDFENISIYVIAAPPQSFSEDEFHLSVEFINYASYESNYLYSPWFHEKLTTDVQYELERQIKYFLPSLFEFNLQNNENFRQTLRATFCRHPVQEILSRYDYSDIFKTKNYFFIPNITSLDRTLSNITITGMQNFESHSFAANSGPTVSTLTIKDIRGTSNLHYADKNFTIFPLYFEVECISITVDRKQQSIEVIAQNYTINETKMNASLTEFQSQWAMEGIQLAIASSIMPSMKYYRNRNSTNSLEEHPIVKISEKLSQTFKSSTIQNVYNDWNITIPETLKAESSIQIESHNYNMSIDLEHEELTPYPFWIKCSLYNNLMVSRVSKLIPIKSEQIMNITGKRCCSKSLLNTTHKFDDVHFVIEDPFIALFKQNKSNDFELKTSLSFYVKLGSNSHQFTDYEKLVIKVTTEELTRPLIGNLVTRLAEPLLSLPLDYCFVPEEIFDDFLPFYADYELPFRVPDDNVIITEWTKSPSAWISIYGEEFVDETADESITTYVNLELNNVEIRMNFNDSSIPFDEQNITLTSLRIQNSTDSGEMTVNLNSFPEEFVSRDNKTVSLQEIYRVKVELQGILDECFNNLTKKE